MLICLCPVLKIGKLKKNETSFDWLRVNDFYEIVREICGDNVESVAIMDKYYHKRFNRYSITFKVVIKSYDPHINDPGQVSAYANSCMMSIADEMKNRGHDVRTK